MTGVKINTLSRFARLACNPLAIVRSALIAASAADELIAASVVPLDVVEGKPREWVKLLPAGKFIAVGHGEFDNSQPDAAIAASRTRAGSTDLAVDYDHALEHVEKTGGKAIASGWIKELKVDSGAIFGRIDWTPAAQQHIADGEYRYISPVFHADKSGKILFLARAGLTNKPAITELPSVAAATPTTEDAMDKTLFTKLLVALNLAADATAEQAIAACQGMLAKLNLVATAAGGNLTAAAAGDQLVAAIRNSPDRGQWIAAAEYNKVTGELAELKKTMSGATIAAAIVDAKKAGKIVPANEGYWLEACTAAGSSDPLKKFLETAPVIVAPGAVATHQAAAGDSTDVKVVAAQLTADEKATAAQMGVTHEAFATSKIAAAAAPKPGA